MHNSLFRKVLALSGEMPFHERLRVGLCLTWVGGFLEVYTYLLHGGVFANAQTGNLLLLAIEASRWNPHAVYYLLPIGAFFVGVFTSEWIRSRQTAQQSILWQHWVLLLEAVVFFVIAFLPKGINDAVVIVAVAFVCAMQFNTFRKAHGLSYASTFCTGNLRSAVENLFYGIFRHQRERAKTAGRYFSVIGAFLCGTMTGYWFVTFWGQTSILLCAAIMVILFVVMKWPCVTACRQGQNGANKDDAPQKS